MRDMKINSMQILSLLAHFLIQEIAHRHCNNTTSVPGSSVWAAVVGREGMIGFVEGILRGTGSMSAPVTSVVQSVTRPTCRCACSGFYSEPVPDNNEKKHPTPQTGKTTNIPPSFYTL